MKKSAQKLLLSLYPAPESLPKPLPTTSLEVILSELTQAGRRSLTHLLKGQGWLEVERFASHTSLVITDSGKRALEVAIPALLIDWGVWDGTWAQVVFLEAPAGDPQFRYLRQRLLAVRCVPLSRGVYLCPQPTLQRIWHEVETLYAKNVVILSIGDWQLGDERSIISREYSLTDHIDAYSGVSKEIERLLASVERRGELDYQQKELLSLVYDRYWQIIAHDPGFINHYYSQAPNAITLLIGLQSLVRTA
jgi:DNA-binding transcriptional regulator PaaX